MLKVPLNTKQTTNKQNRAVVAETENYIDQRKMEIAILHVYFLVLASVRSRCLDPTPGTVFFRELRDIAVASTFKRHLKAELFFRAYGVSLSDSSVTVYS